MTMTEKHTLNGSERAKMDAERTINDLMTLCSTLRNKDADGEIYNTLDEFYKFYNNGKTYY